MSIEWFTVFFSVVTAGIGYYARHLIEKRKELQNEVNKERRKVYQEFVNLTIDQLKIIDLEDPALVVINEKMFEFYKTYMLYASPDVINALSDYKQFQFKYIGREDETDVKQQYQKMSKVIMEMREDLGLSNKELGTYGEKVFRTMLSNYSDIM